MHSADFALEILTPEKADVYIAYSPGSDSLWPIVKQLDRASIGAIADVPDLEPDEQRVRRIMTGCSGFALLLPDPASKARPVSSESLPELQLAVELGFPVAIFNHCGGQVPFFESASGAEVQRIDSGSNSLYGVPVDRRFLYPWEGGFAREILSSIDPFVTAVMKARPPIPPYAFFIGRLERDFSQAREAIRVAVETEAGIPCLWSDDGRHRCDIESISERTRLLIQHATFVIADLTLGKESPKRENPSRAHEIGMAIAYNRKLMLCSQEPRRYPYFSICDMQMTFWSTEPDLECKVREWIRGSQDSLARTVLNHSLPGANPAAKIPKPSFAFDAAQRYIGPQTPRSINPNGVGMTLSIAAIYLGLTYVATMYFGGNTRSLLLACIGMLIPILLWPQLTGRADHFLKPVKVAQWVVLVALALISFAMVTQAR